MTGGPAAHRVRDRVGSGVAAPGGLLRRGRRCGGRDHSGGGCSGGGGVFGQRIGGGRVHQRRLRRRRDQRFCGGRRDRGRRGNRGNGGGCLCQRSAPVLPLRAGVRGDSGRGRRGRCGHSRRQLNIRGYGRCFHRRRQRDRGRPHGLETLCAVLLRAGLPVEKTTPTNCNIKPKKSVMSVQDIHSVSLSLSLSLIIVRNCYFYIFWHLRHARLEERFFYSALSPAMCSRCKIGRKKENKRRVRISHSPVKK